MKLNIFLATNKTFSSSNPKIIIINTWTGEELYNGNYHSLSLSLKDYDWVCNTITFWDLQDNVLTVEISA